MGTRIEYTMGDCIGENGIVFISDLPMESNSARKAIFRCRCGSEFRHILSEIKTGRIKSCGCAKNGVNKIKYNSGDVMGENGIIYLCDAESNTKKRKALFLCHCGTEFVTAIESVKNNLTASCGCDSYARSAAKNRTHGYSSSKDYFRWQDIKYRCYNPKNKGYGYYGARGIKMSDEFLNSPRIFIEYIMSLPNYGKEGYSLDRIDNNSSYSRGNLRWASKTTQIINTRKKRQISGFTGVVKNNSCTNDRWACVIHFCHKKTSIGSYPTAEEAAKARDKYIIDNNLPHRLSGLPLG